MVGLSPGDDSGSYAFFSDRNSAAPEDVVTFRAFDFGNPVNGRVYLAYEDPVGTTEFQCLTGNNNELVT